MRLLRGLRWRLPGALVLFLMWFTVSAVFAAGPDFSADMAVAHESAGHGFDLLTEAVKVIASLGVVLLLLFLFLWLLRFFLRSRSSLGAQGEAIRIIGIQHLDPKRFIALVDILGTVHIIGCAENGMTRLGVLSDEEKEQLHLDTPPPDTVFNNVLGRIMKFGPNKSHAGDADE